jgi:hypothetical protein
LWGYGLFHNAVYRNNADLGKGVPRRHVSMMPGNSSFFVSTNRLALDLSCPPPTSIPIARPCIEERRESSALGSLAFHCAE